MLFYILTIEYETSQMNMDSEAAILLKEVDEKVCNCVNKVLGIECCPELGLSAFLYHVEKKVWKMALAVKPKTDVSNEAWRYIQERLQILFPNMKLTLKRKEEITTKMFRNAIDRGDYDELVGMGLARSLSFKLKIDYDESAFFKVEEELIPKKKLTLRNAQTRAERLLAGLDFTEELGRIYSKENAKKFYGNPVHYHVAAVNMEAAKALIQLLLEALYANKRILGTRINRITEIAPECYNDSDFEHLVSNSQGTAVIIPLNFFGVSQNEYASSYEDAIHFIGKIVREYKNRVLFIFLEIINRKGFAESLLGEICENIRLIHLSEGTGDKECAMRLFREMIVKSDYRDLQDETDVADFPEQMSYKLSDIYRYFDMWENTTLQAKAYPVYLEKKTVKMTEKTIVNNAYQRLQEMVGLKEIKQVTDRIIFMQKVQKLRTGMGLPNQRNAMHMIFTGNPGTAKTTVARLLAEILKTEGILREGHIVECGRADLVGKYVGWTAKEVKKRFQEANGGILFIDEAYSLVDDANSFGDEAINAIVQEMENRKNDVLVIFAGYPRKMRKLLDKNEGLRSRIAFYLDFPDYTVEELLAILKLMLKEKSYTYSAGCMKKCRTIFEKAIRREEFGNGRYVRNVLEQAIMKQSQRLIGNRKDLELTKEEILHLEPEDFEENTGVIEKNTRPIGFYSSCMIE